MTANVSVVSPNAQPARSAFTFASAISGRFAPNFVSRKSTVGSIERPYSHDISPSANMFFERSASRGVTPATSFSAPTVSVVSGISCSWYSESEPSSSGFAS